MTTSAKKAFQTLLQYGDGVAAPDEAFLTLAEVTALDPPEESAKEIDVTNHDSTAAEYIAGHADAGQITADCNFLYDTTQAAARTKLGAAASNWQVCYPNWGARTATFTAATNDVVTSASHGLTTGQPLRVTSSGTPEDLPAGLSSGTTYYVRVVNANTFTLHSTNAGAVANTGTIDITDAGTGTHTLQIGNRLSFSGIVFKDQKSAGLDNKIGVKVTLRPTNGCTLT